MANNALKVTYTVEDVNYAEIPIENCTVGAWHKVILNMIGILSNNFKIHITTAPKDLSSSIHEEGYGTGIREFWFQATQETHYLAIGDNVGSASNYFTVDDVSIKEDYTYVP